MSKLLKFFSLSNHFSSRELFKFPFIFFETSLRDQPRTFVDCQFQTSNQSHEWMEVEEMKNMNNVETLRNKFVVILSLIHKVKHFNGNRLKFQSGLSIARLWVTQISPARKRQNIIRQFSQMFFFFLHSYPIPLWKPVWIWIWIWISHSRRLSSVSQLIDSSHFSCFLLFNARQSTSSHSPLSVDYFALSTKRNISCGMQHYSRNQHERVESGFSQATSTTTEK